MRQEVVEVHVFEFVHFTSGIGLDRVAYRGNNTSLLLFSDASRHRCAECLLRRHRLINYIRTQLLLPSNYRGHKKASAIFKSSAHAVVETLDLSREPLSTLDIIRERPNFPSFSLDRRCVKRNNSHCATTILKPRDLHTLYIAIVFKAHSPLRQ